MVGFTEALRFS